VTHDVDNLSALDIDSHGRAVMRTGDNRAVTAAAMSSYVDVTDQPGHLSVHDRQTTAVSNALESLHRSSSAVVLHSNVEVTKPRVPAAAVRSYVDVTSQPSTADFHRPFSGAAAQTVAAGDGLESLYVHRNNSGVMPVLQSNAKVTQGRVTVSQPQLLPPTAFMSRADGTPILNTDTVGYDPKSCVSAFDKHPWNSISRCGSVV